MFEYNNSAKVQFIKLTEDETGNAVWVNTDHIIYFKQREDYTHIDMTDSVLYIKESVERIACLLRGEE